MEIQKKPDALEKFEGRLLEQLNGIPSYLLKEGAYTFHYPSLPEQIKQVKERFGFREESEAEILKRLERLRPESRDSSLEAKASCENGLVVASGNEIYCVSPREKVLVAERSNWVYALVSHDGRLFDGGWYKLLFDSLENKRVAKRSNSVCALVSHDGGLFDGGGYKAVFDTLNNRKVAERSNWVLALVSHGGRLFDGGGYKAVFDTLSGVKVAERSDWVYALVSHDGRLFDGGLYKAIFDTLSGGKVAERSNWVRALVSHGGRLFDGGEYNAVFDSLNDPNGKNPLWSFDAPVYAMASVPMSLWNELVEKVRSRKKGYLSRLGKLINL